MKPPPLIEEDEAQARLQAVIAPFSSVESVPLEQGLGRIAGKDLRSVHPMPRFDNAMVDGYAVRDCPVARDTLLRVSGEQAAGADQALTLSSGEAIRIFTGAPLPRGTEAVVMQEDVTVLEDGRVRLEDGSEKGEGVRTAGDDLLAGQRIVTAGDVLTPQRLALLASQGMASLEVRPWPKVRVISTGDELMPVGAPLQPGQLYESNALMLCLLGEACGWPGWTRTHVGDDREALTAAVAEAAAVSDFLFLSGGVSVGDHDHVRPVLQALGFEEHFWRVRVQPGKPVLFGTLGQCHILGLPGNPVSSFVSFCLFGVPALHHWMGLPLPPRYSATLGSQAVNRGNRPHYLRGRFDPVRGVFQTVGLQRSHGMLGLAQANAIARVPPSTALKEGERVEVLMI